MSADARRLGARITELSRVGGSGNAVTRLGLTAEEQAARSLVARWLSARGGTPHRDPAGNLFVRFGPATGPTVLVGSHLDSVPEGGRFDGALGVLIAVEAVETLLDEGHRFATPTEIVGWCDEEGARFGIGLYGSMAVFGRLPKGAAERRDKDGVSIADALRALGESGDPTKARRAASDFKAYIEPHIEQGPRLAAADRPLGVVSDIVGIAHGRMTVKGRADHAGTTGMTERHDALLGAATMALALEAAARHRRGAVGTVGEISVRPGAKNVVPAACVFSIDVRAPDARGLDVVLREFKQAARLVADARGLTTSLDILAEIPPVPLDPRITDVLKRAAASVGVDAPALVSGAGHDTMNPQLDGVPSGMLFVRSVGGSHTPREFCSTEDAALAASALAVALRELTSTA